MEQHPTKQPVVSARLVYYLLVGQFVFQFGSFFYLYANMARLERDCSPLHKHHHRSKRSTADDNAVSEIYRDPSKQAKSAGGGTGGQVKGDNYVWLAADTRLSYADIETICTKTKEQCQFPQGPPGYPGMRGLPGVKGERGDPGLPGTPGVPGIEGLPGIPGPRGPPGPVGPTGLDGVDGRPGEPGLDGVPGHMGIDGLPGLDGMNGKPGLDGAPGTPGSNGTDGRDGAPGARGYPGEPGAVGPRGPPGQDGRAGLPGIMTYLPFKNHTSAARINAEDVLIPPSILTGMSSQHLIVSEEGVNVRLECFAAGKPTPVIQWHRSDGMPIHTGIWQASAIYGTTLNLSSVHRDDMGNYTCTADNGIPPSSSRKYRVNVKFGPMIRIRSEVVRVSERPEVVLECEVEAFPRPEIHWENTNGRLDIKHPANKYYSRVFENGDYKFKSKLKINRVSESDLGPYHCVAKNSVGNTRAKILLKGASDKSTDPKGISVVGKQPPMRSGYRDLCPPPLSCDSCPRANCGYTGIEVRPLTGIPFSGMLPRVTDGVIAAVGIALVKGQMDDPFGIWMQDKKNGDSTTFWVTRSSDPEHLYEYEDVEAFKRAQARVIRLPYPFQGNGHVVNDGYFFYNPHNKSSIVRVDLSQSEGTMFAHAQELQLPGLRVNNNNYLYTTKYNYVDFDVDENGLWAIYGTESNGTAVMKVDPETMTAQHAWSITVDHHKYGEMFVARGVLYAVHSVTDRTMNISMAVDLYEGKHLNVSLSFANHNQKVTVLRYNCGTLKELSVWDKGLLLAYPVRYEEASQSSDNGAAGNAAQDSKDYSSAYEDKRYLGETGT